MGEESKNPAISPALISIDKAVDLLYDLGKLFKTSWDKIGDKVRPDYPSCAEGFYKIVKLLRASTWELESLIRSFIYLPVDVLDKQDIETKVTDLLRGDVDDIVSRVKFRCGDIDTIYQQECRSWFQSFLGIKNPVAAKFANKHKDAEKILKDLTKIDAKLVDDLTVKIVNPLKKFEEKIRLAKSKKKVIDEYEKLRPSLMTNIDVIEKHLRMLDEATINFAKLAGRPISVDRS